MDAEIIRLRGVLGEDEFSERIEGIPKRPPGQIFSSFAFNVHVDRLYPERGDSYDPTIPAHLGIDPGYGHYYAVGVFQKDDFKRQIRLIDQIFHRGRTTEEIIPEAAMQPWAEKVNLIVIDHYGGRQHHDNKYSVKQKWQLLWNKSQAQIVSAPVPLLDGYERHIQLLNATKMWKEYQKLPKNRPPFKEWVFFIDPKVTSLIGGSVDGEKFPGEYFMHKYTLDSDGRPIKELPRDIDNDMSKVVNYYAYVALGPVDMGVANPLNTPQFSEIIFN